MAQTNRKALKLFELVFSVFALFHLSGAVTPLILTGGISEGDGFKVNDADLALNAQICLLIYLVSFVLLSLRWKRVIYYIAKNQIILLLVAIICLSYFWSVSPSETFKTVIYALGTTAFGLYLATRYSLEEQFNIFAYTFGLMTILSGLFAVALPQYGIMGGIHEGALRGVFTHKNQFGAIMVLGAVVFLLKAFKNEKMSWLYWLLLAFLIALVVLSNSTTSLGTLGVMLMLCLIYRIFRWRYEILISAILAATVFGFAALLFFAGFIESDSFFIALGKDATLSGRTYIWKYVWDEIQLRPWLGYGLAAFWNGLEGPSAYVQLAMTVEVIYAHNGFLDLCLSIGFVGLIVFLAGFFSTGYRSLALLRQTNTPEGLWPLLFLTYILLSNITEGTITTMNNSFWAIYIAISYSLIIARDNKYAIY
ncbi:O-antigen ligase [Myxosarcina sp. GI1]|uniref:O-antigen ligase family protein n=1 Tax=Myxosarcina sp. GI1 TaxID=1541065 RepID=UPI00055DA652|nr:O-antigen ligase [Myxosarcina sp. GI1]